MAVLRRWLKMCGCSTLVQQYTPRLQLQSYSTFIPLRSQRATRGAPVALPLRSAEQGICHIFTSKILMKPFQTAQMAR